MCLRLLHQRRLAALLDVRRSIGCFAGRPAAAIQSPLAPTDILGDGDDNETAEDTAKFVADMTEVYHMTKFAPQPGLLLAAAAEAWRKVDPNKSGARLRWKKKLINKWYANSGWFWRF